MKKLTARLLTAILLALGLACAGSFMLPADSPLVSNVYADPVPEDTPDPIDTPEPPSNPGDNEADPDAPDDNESPDDENNEEGKTDEEKKEDEEATKDACQEQVGSLSWIVCPTSSVIAGATDALYSAIEDMLVVNPISMGNDSPIYLVWEYLRSLTNIIFIICLLIVIYSQLTGMGLQNYGIKRVLPRLIISVILVNLSFLICALAVDFSNVIGDSLRGTFETIGEQVLANAEAGEAVQNFHLSEFLAAIISGGTIAGFTISALGGGSYIFYMLLVVLIGALVAVISGLITIASRQALVALLIMVSPLAFVAYLLPNTEKWFEKWKDLLFRMLVFYPLFSFLFGASQLVGYTLILAAKNAFGIVLGVAVQIFPLFFGWGLMKMSGTVLEAINRGVRKLAAPIQNGLTGWSTSRAEQRRQHHIASSAMPGAKLRRYLDYRQSLRELDTKNSADTRHDRALEAAYKTASSSRGYDASGNLRWDPVANRYTQNAKLASLYQTRVSTAESAYKNTLTAYGRTFGASGAATRLSNAHAEAYKDNMAQQFLTANEAQADQDYLLGQYLSAQNNQFKDPYEFNRLVKSAAGSLGHTGESSIMGQVIIGNSTIESRRRSEARIMITKFGINKPGFRGMVFDTNSMNDNGIETDENGIEIQDDQYRMKPGHKHTPWQQYIARHKTTGDEITKDEYDNLNAAERSQYRKVKYFDIKDDAGKTVQRVYDDDAGYMKELLNDDIAIGDPINDRYLTEIGVAHSGNERTGILRKYHSTITGALNNTKYKTHNAADSMMVTSQANLGFITSPAQLTIAQLQSLNVAVKPGDFLQNDHGFLDKWRRIICATYGITDKDGNLPKENFEYFFPDEDLFNYRNVNGVELPGMRLEDVVDKDGKLKKAWVEIAPDELNQMTYDEVVEARKNYLKHKVIPKSISRLIGTTNRDFTPNVMDSQKPATLAALEKLVHALTAADELNNNGSIAFEDRPNGNDDLMTKADRRALTKIYNEYLSGFTPQSNGSNRGNNPPSDDGSYDGDGDDDFPPPPPGGGGGPYGGESGGNSGPRGGGGNGSYGSSPSSSNSARNRGRGAPGSGARAGTARFMNQLGRDQKAKALYDERNDIDNIISDIQEIFMISGISFDDAEQQMLDYFGEVEFLQDYVDACGQIFDTYRNEMSPDSTDEAISQITNHYAQEEVILKQVEAEVINLVWRIPRT